MYRDFYATIAQVMPVLLLALIWDSGFLERLRGQTRRSRTIDPDGVRWWTKPRVRAYALTVTAVMLSATGAALAVLAGLLPDSGVLRGAITGAAGMALATLLTRVWIDVIAVTRQVGDTPAESALPGDPVD